MAENDKHVGANAASRTKYKNSGRLESNKRRRSAKHQRRAAKRRLKWKTPRGTARADRREHLQREAA